MPLVRFLSSLSARLFGLSEPVSRRAYLLTGIVLMAVKVAVDQGMMWIATRHTWPLAAYLFPSLILRNEALGPQPGWVLSAMALTTIPFLWVGVSMTVRRAADAGLSPWLGVAFFVPILNYGAMLVLSIMPSVAIEKQKWRWDPNPYRAQGVGAAAPAPIVGDALRAALIGVIVSAGFGAGMIALSIYVFRLYGAALFFATPFLMGTTSALVYNARARRGVWETVGVAVASIVMTGCAILLFGVEGVLCLAMALPIAATLAILGAILGWAISARAPTQPAMLGVVMLLAPVSVGIEQKTAKPELHEVTTSIEIDAPPDVVWKNTVGFSELPPPPEWFFNLGISYPMRAKIDGEGVGAVRRCEFSTGAFVEPITVWEPGKRLAFDVASQPPSMTELSPYRHVNAPHLEGYMVSRRGEFRLLALPGGRTRLEGSTWYTLALFPEPYWAMWGEVLLHSIHGRVLAHIKRLSEAK